MTAPSTIAQRFLSKPSQMGVVAVGFNGGQVYPHMTSSKLSSLYN